VGKPPFLTPSFLKEFATLVTHIQLRSIMRCCANRRLYELGNKVLKR